MGKSRLHPTADRCVQLHVRHLHQSEGARHDSGHDLHRSDNALYRSWFDQAVRRGVQFDVIGLSYYSIWHGTIASLKANMNDVSARYNKPVVVAETAYPFTLSWEDEEGNVCCNKNMLLAGYAATPTGQAANLRDVLAAVRAVPNGRGLGVFYWEPTWTAVDGNGWSPDDASSGNSWET